MNALRRARAYRDFFRVRRLRQTPPLVVTLRESFAFGVAEPEGYDHETIDGVARLMADHPSVASMEVDHGFLSEHSFAVAYDSDDRLLARVDLGPDGILSLMAPE